MTNWKRKDQSPDFRPWVTDVFLETGTSKGHGVQAALDAGFKHVITIEGSKAMFDKANKRFADNVNVICLWGDSENRLKSAIEWASKYGRITYWLDAHNFGGYKSQVGDSPLMLELDIIEEVGRKDDIILIDDVRCFASWTPPIKFSSVVSKLRYINPNYGIQCVPGQGPLDVLAAFSNMSIVEIDGEMFSLPAHTFGDFIKMFLATSKYLGCNTLPTEHELDVLWPDEGYELEHPDVTMEEVSKWMRTVEGVNYSIWAAIRKTRPDITYEWVEQRTNKVRELQGR